MFHLPNNDILIFEKKPGYFEKGDLTLVFDNHAKKTFVTFVGSQSNFNEDTSKFFQLLATKIYVTL